MEATGSDASGIAWWAHGAQGGSAADAADRGEKLLANLLHMDMTSFENEYWQQKPLVHRCPLKELSASHPANMMPLAEVRKLLKRKHPRPARFTHDIDVTRFVDGKRSALSTGHEEVDAAAVWRAFQRDGYSIRIVHPQQWHQASYELCSLLQEYFGNEVGCSAYLTPRNTQGFAPHYDDIEAAVWRPGEEEGGHA